MFDPKKGKFISIDPGLKACGVAYFLDGKLMWCGCARFRKSSGPRQWKLMAKEVANVVERETGSKKIDSLAIERMETRRVGRKSNSKRVHDDLFQLAYVSGGIYTLLDWDCAEDIRPSKWTGSAPKNVNLLKAQKILDNSGQKEETVFEDGINSTIASHKYEVSDAVCIGLFALRRFK